MSSQAGGVFAVVPLNASVASKTRLRGALPDAERAVLARWLASRVLGAITASGAVARVAVVSPDAETLEWARRLEATPLMQRSGGLNDGLELGRLWAVREGANALLVVLGDLPLLRPDDIAELVRLSHETDAERAAVLAPDRERRGTNAFLQRPVDLTPFAFGEGSFERHRESIRAAGVEPTIYHSLGTGFDVDMPADLSELRARKLWPATASADEAPAPERNAS